METKYIKCNLCDADDYTVMHYATTKKSPPTVEEYTSTINKYGEFHNIVKCNSCGLVYMNPRDDKVVNLYKDVVDNAYLESWKERARNFEKHLTILQKYKPTGNLLDMGCYAGIFLCEAQKKGYNVNGIEPSIWGAKYAEQKTSSKIVAGSCEEVHFPLNSFDLVTLWDVIEHLENPSSCLSIAHNYLKNNGILAVTTHNIGSLMARIMGKRYPWLMRFHLYHFTPKTLSALLLKNGFEVILTKNYSKIFSLKYIFSRFGITVNGKLFERLTIPINTGDMFMIIAKKMGLSQKSNLQNMTYNIW